MKQSPAYRPSRSIRVLTACLLSLLMLLAPMAPLAASANRVAAASSEQKAARTAAKGAKKKLTAQEALERSLFVNPPVGALQPVISATLTDSIIDTSPADGRADPSSTVTYTAVVSNTGSADATNVTFTDTPDPNTTLVGGSVKVSPLAFPDAYGATTDVTLNVGAPGVLTNDTGTPTPTAVVLTAQPTTQGGTVTLNADGSFSYKSASGFSGTDTFTYTATNGQAPNDSATVTLTVAPPNTPPTAVNDSRTVNEDASATALNVLANDTDPDGGAKNITSFTTPTNGTVVGVGPAGAFTDLTYTPNANYCNNPPGSPLDTFTYTLNGGSSATVSMTVTCVNDAPVITDTKPAAVTMSEDGSPTPFSLTLHATDADPGDTLTWSISSPATHGTATASGTGASKAIGYTPNANYFGSDSFTVQVSDGNGGTDTIIVNVTISSVNDAPTITNSKPAAVTMSEDGSPTPFALTLNATDVDGDTLTWSISSPASHGTATASGTGTSKAIGYTPNANYFGSDSFTVQVSDGNGGTDTIIVNVTINSVNDAPTITNSKPAAVTMSEDGSPTPFALTLNATDVEGDTLTWSISSPASHGTATASGTGASKAIGYTPNANYNGPDSFTVQVSDGNGGIDTIIVNVNIVAVNDAPTITDSKPAAVTMSEDSSPTAFSLTLHATDADGDAITWSISSPATNGTATASGTGASKVIGYTPNSNYNGSDSFTVQVSDGNGGTDTIIVNVTINPVNDAPVVDLNGVGVGVNVSASFTEDSGGAVLAGSTDVTDVDNANLVSATITLTNRPDGNGVESLSADVTGTLITANYTAATGVLALTGTDTLANYQQVLRTVKYNNTSQNPDTTNRIVNFKANDGAVDSATAVATVTVVSVDDAPVNTVPGTQTVNEDTDLIFSGTISVADVDAGTNSVKVSLDVLHGTLTLNSVVGLTFVDATANGMGSVHFTGTLTNVNAALNGMKYRGTLNFNSTRATETLTIITNDQGNTGTGGPLSDTDTVGITVTAVSDNPVATNKAFNAETNMKISLGGLLAGATDPDDGDISGTFTSTYTLTTVTPLSCAGCTITNINSAAGTFDFDPPPGLTGAFTLNYTITDSGNPGATTSAPATITITVAGPVIWFVDSSVGGPGDGRLDNPFKTIASADAVDLANHNIFLFTGTYANGIALNTGETLIGQGVSTTSNAGFTSFDAVYAITPPAGTMARPSIAGTRPTVQNTVTLNTNTAVRGLNLSTGANTGMNDPGAISGATVTELTVTTSTGSGIVFTDTTSGNFTFGGLTTTAGGAGASLTGTNTSSTFNFSNVNIGATGVNVGLVATGGGTINVTGAGNIISTATGTALNVSNTTIGASGLTFQKISANGATNGIVLNNTGVTAGLTVTGSSAGNCGGSITVQPLGTPSTANAPATADCTGGTIQSTTGHGIVLTSTKNVSLTRMLIQNAATGFDEVSVNSINGLTIDHSDITDSAGNAGDRGIEIGDFSTGTAVNGTITISNSTIGPTPHDNIGIGIASGTSTWSFTNDVLTGSVLDSGMNFEVRAATVTSFLMDNCVVQNQFADGMQLNPASGVNATITSATIQNSTFVTNNIHIDLNHDGTSNVTYKVLNNTFRTSTAQAVNFFTSASAGTGGTANGRFVNNRIGTVASSLSGGGAGIRINVNGGADTTVLLDSNVIRQEPNGRGIEIISRNGTGGTDATVTNNDVDTNFVSTVQNGGFSLSNIFLQSNCLSTCNTLRSNVTGNTVPAVAPTGELVAGQIVLIKTGASTNQLVDNAPASPDAASELASHNTGSTATSGSPTLIAGPINTPPLRFALGGVESALYAQSPLSRFLWPAAVPTQADANVTSRADVNSNRPVNASLDQQELDSIVSAAINRWEATGLTASQLSTLRGLKFEVTDLGGVYLGEAGDGAVQIDRNAGGRGWYNGADSASDLLFSRAVSNTRRYTDPSRAAAGHLDLLTAIEHEMGHKLGLADTYAERDRDSLMYGYLTVGERRLPAPGQAQNAKPGNQATQHLKLRSASAASRRGGNVSPRSDTPITPLAGGNVNANIGTLPAGKSVTITFQVTLNTAMPVATPEVSTRGTVHYAEDTGGVGGAGVPTNDPSPDSPHVGNGPTFTPIDAPTAAGSSVGGQILDSNGNPVEGAGIRMSGAQNRLTVTDAQGFYHFDNVEAGGFYTVIATRANFNFSPSQRSFSALGQHTDAAFNASPTGSALNPLDTTEYFVRQQYVDFLNREPDEAGLNFWYNNIESCGNDGQCRAGKRIDTSAAFFLSTEFQQTGYLVYKSYQAAFGDLPGMPVPVRLGEFKPDTQEIGNGVIVNAPGWDTTLSANKAAFMAEFVQRSRFANAYAPSLTPTEFVNRLFANAGVTPSDVDRTAAANEFGSAGTSSDVAARGRALQRVAENSMLTQQEFTQAFVLIQYFGYLRRDPNVGPDADFSGYNFWLQKLDTFNGNFGNAEMVKSFLVSGEYRGRFPR